MSQIISSPAGLVPVAGNPLIDAAEHKLSGPAKDDHGAPELLCPRSTKTRNLRAQVAGFVLLPQLGSNQ